MRIEQRRVGSSLVIRVLEPRLGADRAKAFKETLGKFVEKGESRLILDLSCVEFIDSSGLGAILSVLKAMGTGGELIVCGTTDPVESLFKLTRMDRIFEVHRSLEDGLNAVCR